MLYLLLFAFTESDGATVAGSFLDGVVAGALLVVGILCGSWKLKHSSGESCKVNSEVRGNVSTMTLMYVVIVTVMYSIMKLVGT